MASGEAIKSFLVELGYSIDEPSQQKFLRGIDAAEDAAIGFAEALGKIAGSLGAAGIALAGAGAAAFAFTEHIAHDMDKLHWFAQNVGAAAQSVEGYSYAISQVGGSAAEAHSTLQSLQEVMRTTPAANSLFDSILRQGGVHFKQGEDTVALAQQLGEAFANLIKQGPQGEARAMALGKTLNLSSQQVIDMARNSAPFFRQFAEDSAKIGVNFNKAADAGNRIETQWRRIQQIFDDIEAKWLTDIDKQGLSADMKQFGDWLIANHDAIESDLLEIAHDTKAAADVINELVTSTIGWRHAIEGLLLLQFGGWLFKLISPLTTIGKLLWDISKAALAVGGAGAGEAAAGGAGAAAGAAAGAGAGAAEVGAGAAAEAGAGAAAAALTPGALLALPLAAAVGGLVAGGDYIASNERTFDAGGWATSTAANGWINARTAQGRDIRAKMAFRDQIAAQLKAAGYNQTDIVGILANLFRESSFDPTAANASGHYGLGQWDATRQAAFAKMFGYDMTDAAVPLARKLHDEVAFLIAELHGQTGDKGAAAAGQALPQATSGAQAALIFGHSFERYGNNQVEDAQREALATQLEKLYAPPTPHYSSRDPEQRAEHAATPPPATPLATLKDTAFLTPPVQPVVVNVSVTAPRDAKEKPVLINQTIHNSITTAGGDAHSIGGAVFTASQRANAKLIRDLRPTSI